jgi:hypothetical protein
MARPTKTPEETRKVPLKFWGTEAEAAEIDAAAASFDLNRSDFMRTRCLGVKPRHKKASPERAALITALGQLGYIRSDINQLVKDRLSHKFVNPEQAERAIASIESLALEIHKILEQ